MYFDRDVQSQGKNAGWKERRSQYGVPASGSRDRADKSERNRGGGGEEWSSGSDGEKTGGPYRHRTRSHNMVRAVGRSGVAGERNGQAVSAAAPLSSGRRARRQMYRPRATNAVAQHVARAGWQARRLAARSCAAQKLGWALRRAGQHGRSLAGGGGASARSPRGCGWAPRPAP